MNDLIVSWHRLEQLQTLSLSEVPLENSVFTTT
jgi:hypothetical protein